MDRVTQYRTAIRETLCQLADHINRHANHRDFSAHAVIDEERDQYLLVKTGWNRSRRVHGTTLYLRIIDGSVWIEEDWTEDGISDELIASGVREDDIVLAFQSPDPTTVSGLASSVS